MSNEGVREQLVGVQNNLLIGGGQEGKRVHLTGAWMQVTACC